MFPIASNTDDPGITYVDDVFSTYLFTTNGANQSINNGIDLAGKGGMVWFKRRDDIENNLLYSTNSGNKQLRSSTTNAYITPSATNKDLVSYNNDGFTIGNGEYTGFSTVGQNYASWTFRKAAKFFDVVTYTGDGVAGRTVAHSLGVAPGMITVKSLGAAVNGGADGFWFTYHRGLSSPGSGAVFLNSTDGRNGTSAWNNTLPTADVFTIDDGSYTNISGRQYVAYLFAHDTAADGMIQCGSYTGNGSSTNPPNIELGWEPQFILLKESSGSRDWAIVDNMRGLGAPSSVETAVLKPNLSNAETASTNGVTITATGFQPRVAGIANLSGSTNIYMAIRRPNKPPTSGTQVYNAIVRTGTGAVATVTGAGFAPDLVTGGTRSGNYYFSMFDRLRGSLMQIDVGSSHVETSTAGSIVSFDMNGYSTALDNNGSYGDTINGNGGSKVNYFFKRAPGFFDVVCYTGTGSANIQAHNLTVVPELIIAKSRSLSQNWGGLRKQINGTYVFGISVNSSAALQYGSVNGFTANDLSLSSTAFNTQWLESSSGSAAGNSSGATYVAYLFATLAGISKVGYYTGNGSSQTINCGFAAGARFILIKCTDAAGDWYIWDTVRGIVGGNDPHLSFNLYAAEVTTDDSIDPDSTGFIVNQVAATNINVTSATYIFLAVA